MLSATTRSSMQSQKPSSDSTAVQQWVFKPNCALSPKGLAAWFCAIGSLSLVVALFWAFQGAWVVLVFAILEVAALATAYFFYARQAGDFEKIEAGDGKLVVEKVQGNCLSREELSGTWVRVEYEKRPRSLIWLLTGGKKIAVGRHLPDYQKPAFVRELRQALVRI